MRFTSVCVVVLSATSAALAAHWPAKNPSINLRLRTLVLTGSDDPADDTVQLPRLILVCVLTLMHCVNNAKRDACLTFSL